MAIGRVPGATGIQPSIVDAKGDLIAATAADSVSRLAAGSNNQVLMADSAQATGLKYANEATATLTTTGDILYASAANTPARLAIGSTDQVLKVSGGIPAWAAASSGALVLTGSNDFTTSSSIVINNCFSSTYDFYIAYVNLSAVSNSDIGISLKLRVSGTSASTNYSHTRLRVTSTTVTGAAATSQSSFPFGYGSSTNATINGQIIEFLDPGIARATKFFARERVAANAGTRDLSQYFGDHTTATAYDGLEIIPEAGTISGSVRVYGHAKS